VNSLVASIRTSLASGLALSKRDEPRDLACEQVSLSEQGYRAGILANFEHALFNLPHGISSASFTRMDIERQCNVGTSAAELQTGGVAFSGHSIERAEAEYMVGPVLFEDCTTVGEEALHVVVVHGDVCTPMGKFVWHQAFFAEAPGAWVGGQSACDLVGGTGERHVADVDQHLVLG